MKNSLIFYLLAFSVACSGAYAQGDEGISEDLMMLYEDEEIVSIATGTNKPIHLAPSVASVITATDIKTSGATTLTEALEMVPGLHVGLSSINRLKPVISIRGIYTAHNPQTLLLMNGVPFVNTFNGSIPNLFQLPVHNIQRIEVIRGPGSAVYGADAFSGVINIITKDAGYIDNTQVGVSAGSFNSQDVWAQTAHKMGEWDVSLSLEYSHTNGDRDRIISSDSQTNSPISLPASISHAPGALDTRYQILNTHVNLSKDNWKFGLWNWQLNDAGIGAGGANALDPGGFIDNDSYMLTAKHTSPDLVPNWKTESTLALYYLDEQDGMTLFPAGAIVGGTAYPNGFIGNPGTTIKNGMLEAAAFYEGWDDHRLRLAAGVQNQHFESNESKNFAPLPAGATVGTLTDVTGTDFVYLQNQHRSLWYLSAQDEWHLAPDWELTIGARYDDYSDFGDTFNPRLALVWATDYNLTTKFLYGRAFRAPSFGELHVTNNPFLLGNSNLSPESIDTYEVAFDYRPSFNLQMDLSIYAYEIDHLIDYVQEFGLSHRAQNAKNQEGHGVELSASWDATPTTEIKGNYSWQHSEDRATGESVADTPGQQLSLIAIWEFKPAWTIAPQLHWVADRKRLNLDSRSDIDDYMLVNVALNNTNLVKNWDFALSIRNALDEDAREPSHYEAVPIPLAPIPDDYPLAGRGYFMSATYNFD